MRKGLVPLAVVLASVLALPGIATAERNPKQQRHTATAQPSTRILLVGDSIAESLGTLAVPTYARSGCGITDGVPTYTNSPAASQQCAAGRDAWLDALPDAETYLLLSTWEINDYIIGDDLVAFGTRKWDAWLTAEYEDVLSRLHHRRVYLVTVPPRAPLDGRSFQSQEDVKKTYMMNAWYKRFAATHAVGVIDLASIMCPARVCLEYVDGEQLRPNDGSHFSAAGAAWAMPRMLATMKPRQAGARLRDGDGSSARQRPPRISGDRG